MGKRRAAILALCIGIFLSGCSGPGADAVSGVGESRGTVSDDEAALSYEVPKAVPNVLVDRLGYEPESDKTVILKGEEMPDTFAVKDAESGETVYTGTVKKRGTGSGEEEYYSYGDFSDLKEPGRYYIQIDKYGESYPFLIHDNLYYSLFQRVCEKLYAMRSGKSGEAGGWQMKETGEEREVGACLAVYRLLLSYELFPEGYTDETGIPESGNGIPDIIDECRYETEWLIGRAQADSDADGIVCGYRAAVFAKFAYVTKNMDESFAGECLAEAEAAWKSAEKDLFVPDDLIALAAAELYRLTGSGQYRGLAEEYLEDSAAAPERMSDLAFYGSVTYMNTKSAVTIELCDAMIRKIMEEAEQITEQSKQNDYLVCAGDEEDDAEALLRETMRVCVVNHVITNQEYNSVIENHFHYLMGRNRDALCHVSYWEGQEMETADIMQDPVQSSAFLFLLSELMSNR